MTFWDFLEKHDYFCLLLILLLYFLVYQIGETVRAFANKKPGD